MEYKPDQRKESKTKRKTILFQEKTIRPFFEMLV